MLDLQDSKKLAVLVEMFGYVNVFRMSDVHGRELRDLRILAWKTRDKIVEMGLWREWQNRIWILAELKYTKETPEIWIEAGITVYEGSDK